MKTNQFGFGVLELLILILLVALLAGLGWIIYHDNYQSASEPGVVNLQEATAYVSSFYNKYNSTNKYNPQIVKQYGTSNLQFYYEYYDHGFDAIECTQESPDRFIVKGVSTSNGVAQVNVQEVFGNSISSPIKVYVVDRGTLKIDSLTCFSPAGNLRPAPTMDI